MTGGGHWTEDRIGQLKQLLASGLSASQVARTLGGVTRNAVIGKAHRLGLTRNSVVRRTCASPPKPPPPPEPVVLPPEPEPEIDKGGVHYTTLTIRDGLCRWPIGDPMAADFHYCGKPCPCAQPYCKSHMATGFVAAQPRLSREQGFAGGSRKTLRNLVRDEEEAA